MLSIQRARTRSTRKTAFYIIQNSPTLVAGTWQGTLHLWSNGVIHLLAALASAWLLQRRRLLMVLFAAFCLIGGACLLLHQPSQTVLASVLYPAGVSLYSVALVAYPPLLLESRSTRDREWRAGLIYAVAGWWSSAMGIALGQHLHRVPTPFLVAAGALLLASTGWRVLRRNLAPWSAAGGLFCLAALLQHGLPVSPVAAPQADSAIARGRQIYIAEGCINCHSQYVRPHNAYDVTTWGPGSEVEAIRRQAPTLIGNRRQGPDLSEVGGRRSPLWLRIHFINPRDVSPRSIMPSYSYLFTDGRGNDLLAYMESLQSTSEPAHLQRVLTTWQPAPVTARENGMQLFESYSATCHLATGSARRRWATDFRPLPPDLLSGDLAKAGHRNRSRASTGAHHQVRHPGYHHGRA